MRKYYKNIGLFTDKNRQTDFGLTQEERDELISDMINYEDGLLTDKESLAMFQQLQEVTTFDLVRNLSRHYRNTLRTLKEEGTIPNSNSCGLFISKKEEGTSEEG
jgi:hypothetical protein